MLAWPLVLGVFLGSTVGWQCAEPLSGWVEIDEVRSENINIAADGGPFRSFGDAYNGPFISGLIDTYFCLFTATTI